MKRSRPSKSTRKTTKPVTDLRRVIGGALNAYVTLEGETQGQMKGSVTQAGSGA